MIGRIGYDVGWLRQRNLVVSMKEVGAESGDGATMIERHRPESPHMVAACQLFFVHEPEWTREGLRKCDALGGQTLSEPFGEEFQHVTAPGKPSSVFRLLAGGKQLSPPLSEVVFDGTAEIFRCRRSAMVHERGREQGRCQPGES